MNSSLEIGSASTYSDTVHQHVISPVMDHENPQPIPKHRQPWLFKEDYQHISPDIHKIDALGLDLLLPSLLHYDYEGTEKTYSKTFLDIKILPRSPRDRLTAEHIEKDQQAWTTFEEYKTRINMLRDLAEEEGCYLSKLSEKDFWKFVKSEPFIRKGNLVLLDNGNLRVAWKDDQGEHLGLQFLGSQMAQYVIFKRRKHQRKISRVVGRDDLEGIRRQIQAFDLQSLVPAE